MTEDTSKASQEAPEAARSPWWKPGKKSAAFVVLLLLVFLVALKTTACGASFGANASGASLERVRASSHWNDELGQFENTLDTPQFANGASAGKVTWEFLTGGEDHRAPEGPIPLAQDIAETLSKPSASGLRVTWMGHSTLLLEMDGATVLTDPVWGERVSPSTVVGPKRFHKPPLPLNMLPALDAVIISHDHYDHLDMGSIQALAMTGVRFYVPLGVDAHLEYWGVPTGQIVTVDWWDEHVLQGSGVRLVSTPARHFSGRSPFDRNSTLWTSWSLLGPKHKIYFSGDTGPTPEFVEIGERLGPFDLTMLEVGAHHPYWGNIHLGPHEAMKAHKALRGKKMLPVHWGTFDLGMHAWTKPAETLIKEAPGQGITLVTPIPGQAVEPEAAPAPEAWWRGVDP